MREGRTEEYSADIVVVACGALSSALLLLRSGNDQHPHGLANASGQVGRNYMRHNMSVLMALLKEPNNTVFQKTLALSDFYFGDKDWQFPMGLIQMCATSHGEQITGRSLPLAWLGARDAVREDGAALASISGCRAKICPGRKTASTTTAARSCSISPKATSRRRNG